MITYQIRHLIIEDVVIETDSEEMWELDFDYYTTPFTVYEKFLGCDGRPNPDLITVRSVLTLPGEPYHPVEVCYQTTATKSMFNGDKKFQEHIKKRNIEGIFRHIMENCLTHHTYSNKGGTAYEIYTFKHIHT